VGDRLAILAKELVASQPDVIIAVGTPAALALQRETRTIPIVFLIVSDPVGAGLVSSLRRPGANMTGLGNVEDTFGGKLLTLLKGMPGMTRARFNPDTAPGRGLYLGVLSYVMYSTRPARDPAGHAGKPCRT
jgi:putative ABC transport system substrate-binding protein